MKESLTTVHSQLQNIPLVFDRNCINEESYKNYLLEVKFNFLNNMTQCMNEIKNIQKNEVKNIIDKHMEKLNADRMDIDAGIKVLSEKVDDKLSDLNNQWKNFNTIVSTYIIRSFPKKL